MKELGEEKYNQLLEWMKEPIINDVSINCLINTLLNINEIDKKQNKKNSEIPLHKEAHSRLKNVSNSVSFREKVIITKNSSGFYTFKDLVFNIESSLVIGRWNSEKFTLDKLSNDDIQICKHYNLKYDENRLISQTPLSSNSTDVSDVSDVSDVNELSEVNEVNEVNEASEVNETSEVNEVSEMSENIHEKYELYKNSNDNNLKLKENIKEEEEEELKNDEIVISKVTDRNEMLSKITEFNILNKEELTNTNTNISEVNPYSTDIIPIVNDKVSRGRKKTVVTSGTTSLKQKAPTVRKTKN